MNLKEIVTKYLVEMDYDGLVNPSNECGCGKNDLFPCCDGEYCMDCEPAYHIKCNGFRNEDEVMDCCPMNRKKCEHGCYSTDIRPSDTRIKNL